MAFPLKLDRPLVVFDIESTGVNAHADRIIELAAVRVEPDGAETTQCWLLNPGVPCLEEEFARVGRNFGATQRRHIDVQRIYHRMEPRDLSAAVQFYLGRDHAGAHGAKADAVATLEVLKAQLGKYEALPKTSAEMDEYLVPHDPLNADRQGMLRWVNGELCVNFGKKKGTRLKDIFLREKSYLRWIVNGSFDTEVRQICRDLLEKGILPPPPKV